MGLRLDPTKSDRQYEREHDLRMEHMYAENSRGSGSPRNSGGSSSGCMIFFILIVLAYLFS